MRIFFAWVTLRAQDFPFQIKFMKSLSLTQNALWNIGSTISNFLLLFIGTPIVVRGLGETNYGIYLLLGMLGGVLAISSFGLGEANVKYIAEYTAKKDFDAVNQTFSATFISYLILGGSISIVLFLFPGVISSILNFPHQESIPTLIRLAVSLFFVNLIGSSIGAIPNAMQRFDIVAVIDFLQNVIRVVTVIIIVSLGYNLKTIMFSVLCISILFFIVRLLIACKLIRSLRLVIPALATFKKVFSYGFFLFSGELVGLIWQYADPIILTRVISPSSVSFFSIPMQLIGKCCSLISAGTAVLLPHVSSEIGKSASSKNLQTLFLRWTQLGLLCSILIYVPMTILMTDFLRLWLSPTFAEKAGVVGTILAFSYIIRGAFCVYGPFLKGMGYTKILFFVTLSSSLCILLCDIFLVPLLGVSGVGYSYILSSGIGVLTIIYCTKILLKIPMHSVIKNIFTLYFAGIAILSVGIYLKSIVITSISGWISFVLIAFLTVFFTVLSLFLAIKLLRINIYFPITITRFFMTRIKKTIGALLRSFLPFSWYKLIANKPLLVPRYYKGIVEEQERYFDLSLADNPEKKLLLIRKYAHILDKGIQRKDATAGHSKDCYHDLVEMIASLPKGMDNERTVLWAKEVIRRFDDFQSGNAVVCRDPVPEPTVSYDDLFSLIQMRRSNRWFTSAPVSSCDAEKMLQTINWASSSCNKQPIKCFYTLDPNLAKKCLKCCKGGTGFSENIPSFWVFCADCRGYVWPTEAFLPYIDTSLGLQNFLLTATTLQISGTLLTWAQHSFEEEQNIRLWLNIPNHYIIVVCAVLGHAEYQYRTPERKY